MKWKKVVKRIFNKIGYGIYKIGTGGEYTLCLPYDYFTYSPWLDERFQKIYGKIKSYTIVKEDRCYIIHKFCQHCLHLEGDFAECGVYKGGTAFLMAYTLENNSVRNKQLHLFDTFVGMPDIADEEPNGHKKGHFGDISLDEVKNYFKIFPFTIFYPGFIPETFKKIKDGKFAFVHIDVDLYQTTKDCCDFFYNRMVSGGVIIFDDYGFPDYKFTGKRAVDEFFGSKPESPIVLRTGQCIIIKL